MRVTIGHVALLVAIGLIALAVFAIWRFETTYPCVRYERQLRAAPPIYVDVGDVLVPIPQPDYYANVCVERGHPVER